MTFLNTTIFRLFIVIVVVTKCFSSANDNEINSDSKLTIQKTTQKGGLLTKSLYTKGLECRTIPVGWNLLHRWAIRVDGNCIALYETKDCSGTSNFVYGQGQEIRGKFSDYIRKINVNSFRSCEAEETSIYKKSNLGSTGELDLSFRRLNDDIPARQGFSYQDYQPSKNSAVTGYGVSRPRGPQPQWDNFYSRTPIRTIGGNLFLTFYSQPNFNGKKYYTAINGCKNIPTYLQNQISSVDNRECVRLFTDFNCQGASLQVQPDDIRQRELDSLHINDLTLSFSACEEFQKLGLELNNYYRALHNSPPLRMSEALNNAAQLQAEKLAREPALPRPIGFISAELFYAVNNGPTNKVQLVIDAVSSWYKESEFYDSNNPVASRFTQLVWKNMTMFGVGIATVISGANRRSAVVANYDRRGNFAGQFKENVLPLVRNAHLLKRRFEQQHEWFRG